eukprot:4001542-Pyramimonas_sp.AAC.1
MLNPADCKASIQNHRRDKRRMLSDAEVADRRDADAFEQDEQRSGGPIESTIATLPALAHPLDSNPSMSWNASEI